MYECLNTPSIFQDFIFPKHWSTVWPFTQIPSKKRRMFAKTRLSGRIFTGVDIRATVDEAEPWDPMAFDPSNHGCSTAGLGGHDQLRWIGVWIPSHDEDEDWFNAWKVEFLEFQHVIIYKYQFAGCLYIINLSNTDLKVSFPWHIIFQIHISATISQNACLYVVSLYVYTWNPNGAPCFDWNFGLVLRGLASLTWHRTRWWNDSKRWQESGWLILWFSDNSSCFFEAIIPWYIYI